MGRRKDNPNGQTILQPTNTQHLFRALAVQAVLPNATHAHFRTGKPGARLICSLCGYCPKRIQDLISENNAFRCRGEKSCATRVRENEKDAQGAQ
jgi:hypothetical protein